MIVRKTDKKCLGCDNEGGYANGYCTWCRRKHAFALPGNINLNHDTKHKTYINSTDLDNRKHCVYPNCTETMNCLTRVNTCIKHRVGAKILLDNGRVLDYNANT